MKPYNGTEVWTYFVLAGIAIAAAVVLWQAYRIEKAEKAEPDTEISAGVRKKKYLFFGGFAVLALSGIAFAFAMQPISQNNFREAIVKQVESNNVKLVEGFVDPTQPLRPESHAKFVVESDSGLIRCRANAAGADKDIEFLCQNLADKDRNFTVPLSKVNEPVEKIAPSKEAETKEKDEKEATPKETASAK